MGLRLGWRDVGIQSAPLRLTETIRLALETPDIWTRWLAGEDVFVDVVYPEPADESHLIAQFMRQYRRQVWVERETMQRVISTCLNAPGTWARYTADGVKSLA